MSNLEPRRSDVWQLSPDVNGEVHLVMVISSEAWNRKDVDQVLVLNVYKVARDEEVGPYEVLFGTANQTYLVDAATIAPVEKSRFVTMEQFRIVGDLLAEVEDRLRAVFSGSATRTSPPARYPRAGQVRWADLQIPGEGDKPVLTVSSDEYAHATAYELLVCCRVTSRNGEPHEFEVSMRPEDGIVVCSDLRTITADQVRRRPPPRAAVPQRIREAVMERVHALLGL